MSELMHTPRSEPEGPAPDSTDSPAPLPVLLRAVAAVWFLMGSTTLVLDAAAFAGVTERPVSLSKVVLTAMIVWGIAKLWRRDRAGVDAILLSFGISLGMMAYAVLVEGLHAFTARPAIAWSTGFALLSFLVFVYYRGTLSWSGHAHSEP